MNLPNSGRYTVPVFADFVQTIRPNGSGVSTCERIAGDDTSTWAWDSATCSIFSAWSCRERTPYRESDLSTFGRVRRGSIPSTGGPVVEQVHIVLPVSEGAPESVKQTSGPSLVQDLTVEF